MADLSAERRELYAIEKELATRLRGATQDERRALYGPVYDERLERMPNHPLLKRARDADARRLAAEPQSRLVEAFCSARTVLLEVGPGDCALVEAIAPTVDQVYALDVSSILVQDRELPANVTFGLTDGIDIDVPPGSVSVAYSDQMMEHVHPDDAFEQLRNIHAALETNGRYICVTPNRLAGPHDISRFFTHERAEGLHLREYTVGELRAVFERAGFRRVRALATYQGKRLLPPLPIGPIALYERLLELLPEDMTRRLARPLIAFKVVGTK